MFGVIDTALMQGNPQIRHRRQSYLLGVHAAASSRHGGVRILRAHRLGRGSRGGRQPTVLAAARVDGNAVAGTGRKEVGGASGGWGGCAGRFVSGWT